MSLNLMSWHAVACHVIFVCTIHVIPYHTIPYHAIPYHTISCSIAERLHTLSCTTVLSHGSAMLWRVTIQHIATTYDGLHRKSYSTVPCSAMSYHLRSYRSIQDKQVEPYMVWYGTLHAIRYTIRYTQSATPHKPSHLMSLRCHFLNGSSNVDWTTPYTVSNTLVLMTLETDII